MKRKVKFYTLGCKANQYETQAMREGILNSGAFSEADPGEKADIYLINTCTVTAKADRDSRWMVRRWHRENPRARIIVTGCLAELDGDMVKGLPGVAFIIKNRDKHRVSDILKNETRPASADIGDAYAPLKISAFHGHTKAFVKIQDGCDNHCSYCKIPLVRGRSRSRGLTDILEEIERLLASGFKEMVLTGICLGDWGKDLKGLLRLSDCLEKISAIEGDFRVRLSSIEPDMVTEELLSVIKRSAKICRHLHIPLQSGSNKILQAMKRPYTAGDYLRLIKKIKGTIPNISVTSDIMVGFPGESKRDFNDSVRLIRRIGPSRLHIFTYSPRRGTKASRFKSSITTDELKRRRAVLEEKACRASYNYRRRFIKRKVEGLIESKRDAFTGLLTGYTGTYIRFLLDGPDSLMGKLLSLRAIKADLNSTFCKSL